MAESKTHTMTVARFGPKEYDYLNEFLNIAEQLLEKPRYGLGEPGGDWEQWDNEDEDKIELIKIREEISKDEGISLRDVDNRILFYELLRRRFAAVSSGWRRVITAADVWETNAQDPTADVLKWLPGMEYFHVANEQ